MDSLSLPAGYLEAGEEYRIALKGLGLDPEGLFWAWDRTIARFVLILITSHMDHAGPFAINEALFKAYNASATPREISPFIVRLHSPDQAIVDELQKTPYRQRPGKGPWKAEATNPRDGSKQQIEILNFRTDVFDISFLSDWVYVIKERKPDPVSRNRAWKRFTQNIEKIAA